jgi:hypothetical protein
MATLSFPSAELVNFGEGCCHPEHVSVYSAASSLTFWSSVLLPFLGSEPRAIRKQTIAAGEMMVTDSRQIYNTDYILFCYF